MAGKLMVREKNIASTMGSLPREGEVEVWNKVLASRGKPIAKDFWKVEACECLSLEDLILYQIEEITYEDEAPQLEALENALSCMTVSGMNLVYLIVGEKGRVSFYFGVARDYQADPSEDEVKQIGDAFLKPALEGNFRGSIVRELDPDDKRLLVEALGKGLSKPANCRVLSGVPGSVKDKENRDFRGVDRLVDIMQGDTFGLMILAKPIAPISLAELRQTVFKAYEMVSAASKQSVQVGMNEGQSKNISVNIGKSISTSNTHTTGTNKNESMVTGSNTNEKRSEHSRFTDGTNKSKTVGGGSSISNAKGKTESENVGRSESEGSNRGSSVTVSSDLTNKLAADWVKYFDDVVVPRLDYARGKGAYVVNTVLFGSNPHVARKLAQAARSIFAGEMANMVPLLAREPTKDECAQLQNLTIPYHPTSSEESAVMPYAESGLMAYAAEANVPRFDQSAKGKVRYDLAEVLYAGNWMSVRELAQMAGLPQKEVVGLRLKEEVEFGLNVPAVGAEAKTSVRLGTLVKSGSLAKGCDVELDGAQLDRHVFVAGVTGSGKTTTCQTLLLSSGWPFLVIEPAKTEYRGLKNAEKEEIRKKCKDLLVFTLGDDTVAPFRLNPFELIPDESVTARVDMLMASITAAFDMEAAIPQLIERAIYACYEECGWNVDDKTNSRFEDPFADGVFAFPTLSDVLRMTEKVVDEQGFDDRLKRDYIGSIKARLQGLTLGAKGFMLDCPRSVDFMKLLDRQVILELEPIPNAAQKSLVIGFVLTNLLQAVKRKCQLTNAKVNHITLIEEAHRLLSKPEPGGSPSQKQAAETFADMLAEIRKYGESLIIADQIPGKLTPEVMKNTNTKIIHRLFAQDDKEAVGHTMGLEEDQAKFLSNLAVGRAIVFNGNWPKAIQVQIAQTFQTDAKIPPNEKALLRADALAFYADDYKRGAYGMSHLFAKKPTAKDLEAQAKKSRELAKLFAAAGGDPATQNGTILVSSLLKTYGEDVFVRVLKNDEAVQDFARIFDTKVQPKDFAIPSLRELITKEDRGTVWCILASRRLPFDRVQGKARLFEGFLKAVANLKASNYADNTDAVKTAFVEARKALNK